MNTDSEALANEKQDPRFHGVIESELLIPVCICERPWIQSVQCLSAVHIIGRLNCKSLFAGSPL